MHFLPFPKTSMSINMYKKCYIKIKVLYQYIWYSYGQLLNTLWVQTYLRRGVLDTTLCDKVCQWLLTGQWFSPGTPVSYTNKTDRHDKTEILLKVSLKHTTYVVIDTDCIGSCRSNYHTIMTTMAPRLNLGNIDTFFNQNRKFSLPW
jgi:hypothetical protein